MLIQSSNVDRAAQYPHNQLHTSWQEEARGALESALGQKKTGFEKWGMGVEKRQQRDRRGGPGPAAGGGGGRSGGGGAWLRWFSSGGFWDAAKQTVLTILGIIAAVKGAYHVLPCLVFFFKP